MAIFQEGRLIFEDFEAGQSTDTPLTFNCNATCSATGDQNDNTYVSFLYRNQTVLWNTLVSSSSQTAKLSADITLGVITLKEGLTVKYHLIGNTYMITVEGVIIDNGSPFPQTGKLLGIFPSKG